MKIIKQVSNKKEAEQLALEARTIDKVNCGEQQPEVDHNYKGERSNSGYDDEQFWRNTRSYISYQLSNKNKRGKVLIISTLDDFKLENISIIINEKPIENVSKENKTIQIKDLDSEKINIKISTKNNVPSPRFTEFRVVTD